MESAVSRASPGEAPELLERAAELQAIDGLLAAARGGSGGCLTIEAAAGLGKSRLVAAALERAGKLDMRGLHARGDELERDFAFGAALQLFEPALAELPEAERAALLDGAARLAAPLLVAGEAPPEGQQAFSITHGLHWVAANLAERRPLLIAIDDAHWCDAATLRFARYLLQRVDELPAALLVSARPGAGGPQARLIAQIAAHPLSTVLAPAPFSPGAVARVVRAQLSAAADDDLCGACAAATGGNPFYLQELIGSLAGDALPSAAEVGRLAPASVARTVLARLGSLPEDAGALAAAAAVLGDGAPLDQVSELAGLDRAAAAVAADALADAAILEPGLPPRFRHPIVRDAVLEGLPPARRAERHASAARLLLARGADAERAASHIVVSDAASEPWAVEALRAAARGSRRRGAHDAAARYLQAALSDHLPAAARREVLVELAYVEAVGGADGAAERSREAIALIDSPRERAQAALDLGLALVNGGRHAESAALLEDGLLALAGRASAGDELEATLRAARAAIGGLDFAAGAPGGLDAVLERTARGVATPSERLMLAHGAFAKALAGEDLDGVRRLALGALDGSSPDAASATEMSALTLSTTALLVADDLGAAERALTAAIESARERGSVIAFAVASHVRSHTWFRLGRLEDAIADAQSVLDAARYGWEPALPAAHAVLANALVERGELDAAAAALALSSDEERWSDSFTWNDYLEARAHLALVTGDPEAALADALRCGERLAGASADHSSIVPWRGVAARAAARCGDLEQAGRLADEDVALARRFGAPWALARALRCAGELAGGDRGVDLLREALVALDGSPAALERAHALAALGEALLAERHRVAAREPLREALELAHRCGAEALEARVRAAVVAAGARPRRPDITGRDALTPRELRLARMAADGLGNRDIAEALFITRKTVETHLARAYRKLGIASREELAAALGEREVS